MRNLLLIALATILFQFLFWDEKLGINALLYSLFIVGVLGSVYGGQVFRRPEVLAITASTFFTVLLIVWHNSLFAKIMWVIALMGMVGLVQQAQIRQLLHALVYTALAVLAAPYTAAKNMAHLSPHWQKTQSAFGWLRYAALSLLVLPVFFGLYYVANAEFAALCGNVWQAIGELLWTWFSDWSLWHILFLCAGASIAVAVVLRQTWQPNEEAADTLVRSRHDLRGAFLERQKYSYKLHFSTHALLTEYRIALVLFVLLNVLLLVVNASDIRAVWLADTVGRGYAELRSDLHDGTFSLIFSIGLAMAIVGYFLRGNLNFYTQNLRLRQLIYGWIAQNGFLTLSVLLRNAQYIAAYGLAYKRIGVLVFLAATFVGLFTMLLKVHGRKTLYYLVRTNTWVVFGLLCATRG